METSTRNLASSRYGEEDRKYAHRKPYSGEIRGTLADRIVRHHSDRSRSNIYGGSRASKGPYDRHQKQTWQAKAERTKHTVPSVRSREIIPYEQSSPIRYDGLNGSIDHQGIRSGDGKTAKRLASTIVTPSRSGHDMEENVTKRAKGLTRFLSFTSLSEQEPVATAGDNQIIGALNDMDIEDQQDDEVMECEAPDEDLLGMDLKEMEDTAAKHGANMKTTCQDDNGHEAKALKISKQGTRANVPLGFQSKNLRSFVGDLLVSFPLHLKEFIRLDTQAGQSGIIRVLRSRELRQVILEGWKSEDLPPGANIIEHIASC
ncbi:hypothetical protein DY000_02021722 [Brassica cretica]|uniref:DUF4283 domain-containing protein n=1 Tax=Brassica cretica TaxID=69181 RepID=A0ABQ7E3K5_BRACR|nr:hypothetical protein DY000_02021722 [Brassica cretica]